MKRFTVVVVAIGCLLACNASRSIQPRLSSYHHDGVSVTSLPEKAWTEGHLSPNRTQYFVVDTTSTSYDVELMRTGSGFQRANSVACLCEVRAPNNDSRALGEVPNSAAFVNSLRVAREDSGPSKRYFGVKAVGENMTFFIRYCPGSCSAAVACPTRCLGRGACTGWPAAGSRCSCDFGSLCVAASLKRTVLAWPFVVIVVAVLVVAAGAVCVALVLFWRGRRRGAMWVLPREPPAYNSRQRIARLDGLDLPEYTTSAANELRPLLLAEPGNVEEHSKLVP